MIDGISLLPGVPNPIILSQSGEFNQLTLPLLRIAPTGHLSMQSSQPTQRFHILVLCLLDVGASIDAISGIIDVDRPFASDWTNYQIDESELYAGVDYLAYNGKGKHILLEREN